MRNTANLLTCLRILCSLLLLQVRPMSPAFYVLYLTAGLSDMLDGPLARKTGTAGTFGSRLDTAADLVFVLSCLIRLLPVLELPLWITVWIGAVALLKFISAVLSLIIGKSFLSLHNTANRAVGLLLFLFPLTFRLINPKYSAPFLCAAASFAALWELHSIPNRHRRSDL